MTHVVFHPAQSWTTGDGPVPADQPPPYLVTLTVPEAWREEISQHSIGAIATALERRGTPDGSKRPGGDVWVNVVGVADGSIGLNGKPSSADDVVLYMTDPHAPWLAELAHDPPRRSLQRLVSYFTWL